MRLFDTHSHLDDEQFDGVLDEVIERARAAGLAGIVSVGTTAESSRAAVRLAGRYPMVVAAVGIQPNYCIEAEAGDWDRVVELAKQPDVVAVGETGLDRHWDFTPFETQRDYFDRHLRLSQASGLPFIVHMRDCEHDILEMLREARRRAPLQGIMHSFTGTLSTAEESLELGLYVSFAGMVTYPKSADLRNVAAEIPADRILVETDAPYLSPQPVRGKRPNEPARVTHTAVCLADVRGEDLADFAEQTTGNAQRLLGTADRNRTST
jgi:TatD DNase family protein